MANTTDLDDVKGGGLSKKRPLPDELVEVLHLQSGAWTRVRLYGPVYTLGGYWVKTKKKDGGSASFYTPAPSYNYDTQTRDEDVKDPWRDAAERINTKNNPIIRFSKDGWMNCISRKLQKKIRDTRPTTKKEKKTGIKNLDSESETPVRGIRLSPSLLEKIKKLKGLNVVEKKKGSKSYAVSDEMYGCDISIMYDKDADTPANTYSVQLGERTPLTEEEKKYLIQDLAKLQETEFDDKEVKSSFDNWAKRNGVKMGKKSKYDEDDIEDFDDDDEEDFDDDDEDEDEKPKKKSKGKSKSKSKSKKKSRDEDDDSDDDDDDDSDDDDDDDDDEDEKPKKKSKSKSKSKKSKKSKDDDDDFDDEDEDEDDDSDDDDDDDDDEDDEKPKKKSKSKSKAKSKSKSKSKSKKKSRDDDDDDDDDDDEDD